RLGRELPPHGRLPRGPRPNPPCRPPPDYLLQRIRCPQPGRDRAYIRAEPAMIGFARHGLYMFLSALAQIKRAPCPPRPRPISLKRYKPYAIPPAAKAWWKLDLSRVLRYAAVM